MTPGSVSRAVVADKVAIVRRMLDGIRSLPLDSLADFTADPRMVAAADSYLRRALEALLDLARHVLAKGFGRAPAEYAEVAHQLGEVEVIAGGDRLDRGYIETTFAELEQALSQGDLLPAFRSAVAEAERWQR